MALANSTGPWVQPKYCRSSLRGTPKRNGRGLPKAVASFHSGLARLYSSRESSLAVKASSWLASRALALKKLTQSSVRQAGTTPAVEIRPLLALSPTRLFSAAGTRPEPAVSVPRAKLATPRATANEEPELEPPAGYWGSTLLRHTP
ncbi:hypothetical protein D9M73_171160 [compost metagenome]